MIFVRKNQSGLPRNPRENNVLHLAREKVYEY